jgi:hypothetical protein
MTFLRWAGTLTALVVLIFTLSSCDITNSSDSDSEPELDLVTIGSVTSGDYTISLESDSMLETGVNQLYWKIEQDGNLISPGSITITPLMDMGDMMHSTPFQQPEVAPEDDRYFSNMAVFIMASGSMGSWSIGFDITLPNQEVLIGEIPVEVNSSWRLTSVRDDEDNIYFITWMHPRQPVTGNNTLAFMVHTRESMMSFPPVVDAELEIYPYMDMGGGSGHSTEFTAPDAQEAGYYEGSINYSMSGTWTTSVSLTAGDVTLPEVMFEYSVQAQ